MHSAELKDEFFTVLDRVDGNVCEAARIVGMSRDTAYGWVRKAGMRGRGKTGTGGDPGRARYEQLRGGGVSRREGGAQIGVDVRAGRGWERGIRKVGNARLHPDG
ncbi:IS30 family transposase, partial [Gordonia paraffinivorans]|nr:IS30 family transposase [Gordonia paraffinivorans]